MNNFLPSVFGRTFHDITMEYLSGIGLFISPIFHILTIIVIILTLIYGNRIKKIFTIYFLLNYLWIFMYVGIYMTYLFIKKMGLISLAFWGITPILLFIILLQWIMELFKGKIDINFKEFPKWRLLILPVIFFGFYYPTFVFNQGFKFLVKDFLFSFYGLMPCPTTMVVLGLFSLKYPDTNKSLFLSLTLFSIIIGTAQIAIKYVPDYPLAFIGYYSLLLMIIHKIFFNKISSSVPKNM